MDNDNFKRGDRGEAIMHFYAEELKAANPDNPIMGGTIDLSGIGGDADTQIAAGYPVSDMLADICHMLQRHGIDVGETFHRAMADYGSDVLEAAWENNEEWSNTLQDVSNRDRAIEVMKAAGVPEEVIEEALRRSGINGEED